MWGMDYIYVVKYMDKVRAFVNTILKRDCLSDEKFSWIVQMHWVYY